MCELTGATYTKLKGQRDTARAMSRENVEIVRQFVQAFNRRDLAAMSKRFDS